MHKKLICFFILASFPVCGTSQWMPAHTFENVPFTNICVTDSSLLRADDSLEVFFARDSSWHTAWATDYLKIGYVYFGNLLSVGKMVYCNSTTGLLISSDYGRTWRLDTTSIPQRSSDLSSLYSTSFAHDGDTVYFCIDSSIYRTRDAGAHWIFVDSSLRSPVQILSVSHDTLLAESGYYYLYRSTNGGGSWSKLSENLPGSQITIAGTDLFTIGQAYTGVNKSTNEGKTWQSSDAGVPVTNYIQIVACGSKLILATDAGIYLSNDLGKSWNKTANELLFTPFFRSLAVNGSRIFAGTGSGYGDAFGAFISNDTGNTWSLVPSAGLERNSHYFSNVIQYHDTLYGAANGVWYSTDEGDTWLNSPEPDWTQAVDIAADDDHLYVMGFSSGPLTFNKLTGQWNDSYLVSQAGQINATSSGIFAFSGTKSLVSSDFGNTWNSSNFNLPTDSIERIVQIGSKLYAIFNNGPYRSDDGGKIWKAINFGLSPYVGNITGVPGAIYLLGVNNADEGTLFFSSDDGDNWISDWTVHNSNSPFLIAANDQFVCAISSNYPGYRFSVQAHGTAGWKDVGSGLDSINENILSLAITSHYAVIATTTGVYRMALTNFGTSGVVELAPSAKQSIAGYPNPCSQSTTITFSSPSSGPAEVTVVNLLGVEVVRIFSGGLGAGEHSFSWDTGGVAPGIYECVVRENGNIQRIPLSVVR